MHCFLSYTDSFWPSQELNSKDKPHYNIGLFIQLLWPTHSIELPLSSPSTFFLFCSLLLVSAVWVHAPSKAVTSVCSQLAI